MCHMVGSQSPRGTDGLFLEALSMNLQEKLPVIAIFAL
jgi:hypothetical protein